jgi:uncharacterized protein
MNCPKCTASMELVTIGEYEVDRCTGCGGKWFDLREHERIIEAGAEAVAKVDRGPRSFDASVPLIVNCPRCHVAMLRLVAPNHHHIHYESCPVCYGVFLDAGELIAFADESPLVRIVHWFNRLHGKQTLGSISDEN